jgi:UDP-N-acetylglucosamine 3-dehydrogenase
VELLKREDIDAVSVAVPTGLHRDVAVRCIGEGKDVLVEKPISDSIEGAREIIEEAEKNGVILAVGHIERFNPAVRRLKRVIEEEKLGEIISILARRVGIFPPQIKDANVFLDLAVHDIDIFNYLLDSRPKSIFARAGEALSEGREDHSIILLDYGRTNCVVQVNWITPVKIRSLSVTGTRGYAELDYISQDLSVYESIYEKTYDSFGDFIVKFGKAKKANLNVKKEEPLKAELRHFIRCIEKRERPLVGGEEALLSLRLSLEALRSYRENKVIEVDYE